MNFEFCDSRLRIYLLDLVKTVPLHLLERIDTHSMQIFSRLAINLIFWTCIQRSAPLSTAIFVTPISDNEMNNMSISNFYWRKGWSQSLPWQPNGQSRVGYCCPIFNGFVRVLFTYLVYWNYYLMINLHQCMIPVGAPRRVGTGLMSAQCCKPWGSPGLVLVCCDTPAVIRQSEMDEDWYNCAGWMVFLASHNVVGGICASGK